MTMEKMADLKEMKKQPSCGVSQNILVKLASRERGCDRKVQSKRLSSEFVTRYMLSNRMMKGDFVPALYNRCDVYVESEMSDADDDDEEGSIQTGTAIDRVLSSQWVNHKEVIFGTTSGELILLDVNKFSKRVQNQANGAIFSVKINPSQTLLLACVEDGGVAVYKLPSLQSDYVLVENEGWDRTMATWLNDENFVSGNYEGISHWRVTTAGCPNPKLSKIKTKPGMLVHSLCYNVRMDQIAVLTPGHLHCLDAGRLETVMETALTHVGYPRDNICLAIDEECQLYGVGSKGHINLADTRTLQVVKEIPLGNPDCVTTSFSINGNLLTIGTSQGSLLFWDIKADKFLQTAGDKLPVSLTASECWFTRGFPPWESFKSSPAIFTHCLDPTGSRLFAAGGPYYTIDEGGYIGIWH